MIGDDGGTSKKVKPFPPILLNIYIENNRTSSHFWQKSGRICIIIIIDSKMYRDVYIPAYDKIPICRTEVHVYHEIQTVHQRLNVWYCYVTSNNM